MKLRYTLVLSSTLALVGVVMSVPAIAVNAMSGFDPNNLISDQAMYGEVSTSMTEAEISAFLAEKGKDCIRGNDGSACIKDARFDTQSFPASQWCPEPYEGADNESAAAIIAKSARACKISPKVLLVLLQKEQGLIQTKNPTKRAYERATGFACPDTAPCDPSKSGFAIQVYAAASRLQQYKAQPHRFNFAVGRTTRIGYHPNASCGFVSVTPKTAATAALYNYTPYVPNAAALANPYGAGDSCSAYGNRNFFRIHSDWFGKPNQPEAGAPTPQPPAEPEPGTGNANVGESTPSVNEPQTPQLPELIQSAVPAQPSDLSGDGTPDFLLPHGQDLTEGFGWGDGGEMDVVHLGNEKNVNNQRTIGVGWNAARTIDGGDWDGDGFSDLMLIRDNGQLWLYPGRPNFTWGNARQIGNGWSGMDRVLGGADFDGDNRPDLLARHKKAGELYLYSGNGYGGFAKTKKIGWGWGGFSHLALIPGWKDHVPALAAVNAENGRLHVYSTNGRAQWTTRYDLGYGWNAFASIAGTRDITGDGRGDLLTITADGEIRTYPAAGNSFSVLPVQSTDLQAGRVLPAGNQYDTHRYIVSRDGRLTAWDSRNNQRQSAAERISTGIYAKSDEKLLNVGDWDGRGYPDIIKWNSANEMILHAGIAPGKWDTNGRRIGVGWVFDDVIPAQGWAKNAPQGLLAWNKRKGILRLFPADANGNWLPPTDIGTGLTWADKISTANHWNGTKPQILARESGNGRLHWIGGDAHGLNVDRSQVIGVGWRGIADFTVPTDLTGDKHDDVLAIHPNSALSIYSGTGQGAFGKVEQTFIR